MLKRKRVEGTAERVVLAGCVMSRAVISAVSSHWKRGMFPSDWGNQVAEWCVEHFRKYGKPPKAIIADRYTEWAEVQSDQAAVKLVKSFLDGVADEFARLKESVEPEYLIDKASELLESVRLSRLSAEVQQLIENGQTSRASELWGKSSPINLSLKGGLSVLENVDVIDEVFASRAETLIEYPDAAGNFFSTSLARDSFIAFMGKEKGGKSFWLLDVAYRGVQQGRKVAYFETGDSSQSQVLGRIYSRMCERPFSAGEYRVPTLVEQSEKGDRVPHIVWDDRRELDDLSKSAVIRAQNQFPEYKQNFRLSCHPNASVSVADVEGILDQWSHADGWRPDVVVVDYADIMKPMPGHLNDAEYINATWMALRGLSQKWHCLVVTATQTDADAYDTRTLSRSNFSRDKRKYAHVNGMIGINQNDKEKELNLFRLNWVVRRELAFSERTCLHAVGCLAMAHPCIVSTF